MCRTDGKRLQTLNSITKIMISGGNNRPHRKPRQVKKSQ